MQQGGVEVAEVDRVADDVIGNLSRFQHSLPGWEADSKAAALLAGALENDH